MAKQPRMKRWVIRAGPGLYIAKDGSETTHKHQSANYSTGEEVLAFAKRMNIKLDGAMRYPDQENFKASEVRGMLEEKTKHEQYKGHDIRSCPSKEENGWKVHLVITFPPIHDTTTSIEIPPSDGAQLYSTLEDAHTAGFELGRRIIDQRIQEQSKLHSFEVKRLYS